MSESNENINTDNMKSDLNDLSFSFMVVNSEKKELEDLEQSIKELGKLVDYLESKNKI